LRDRQSRDGEASVEEKFFDLPARPVFALSFIQVCRSRHLLLPQNTHRKSGAATALTCRGNRR
jgi:hypothetical protein